MVVRDLLAQQDAWIVAAAGYKSTPTLGQSGPLTGLQLFVRINCKLGLLGQEPVDVPNRHTSAMLLIGRAAWG